MICISVCIGTSCYLNGANNVVMSFQHLVEEYNLHDKVTISAAFCMQTCAQGSVSIKINDEPYAINANDARKFFKENILPLVTK